MRKQSLLEEWVKNTIRFRWGYIVLLTVFSFLSITAIIRGIQIDNSLGIWFLEDDDTYIEYLQYQTEYGSDEIIIAVLPASLDKWPDTTNRLQELSVEIESYSGVHTTFSLAKANYPLPTRQGLVAVPFYDSKRKEEQQLKLFGQLKDYRSQLISDDFQQLFFYVQLDAFTQIEEERSILVSKIETAIRSRFQDAAISGPPVLNEAYNKALQGEAGLYGILTLLVISLLLYLLLPDRRFVWMASAAIVLPALFLFGLIAAFKIKLNMISALIPTLLLVYALSDVVHIINALHYQLNSGYERSKVHHIVEAIRWSIVPCALTTATTIIGYFALNYSALPALKSMGLWASIGILLAFLLAYLIMVLGVSFISLSPSRNKAKTTSFIFQNAVSALVIGLVRCPKRVLLFSSAFLLLSAILALRVEVDTNSLDLLADSRAKDELLKVESALGSSSRLQLNLTLKDSAAISYEAFLQKAGDFHEKLQLNPKLGTVFSLHSLRTFLEQRYAVTRFGGSDPKTRYKKALKNGAEEKNVFFNLASEDLNTLIFTLGFSQMPTAELSSLLDQIEEDFISVFGSDNTFSLQTNGFATVFAKLNEFVVSSQLKTFGVALVIIFFLLALYFSSMRKAALLVLPNLIPIFGVFALMTLLGISLGVTTAMITPIILGIAMDDTLHLIYHFIRPSGKLSIGSEDRLNAAIRYSAPALLTSTISLVAGFAVIAISNTPAVREFGLLCLVAITIALIADLTFLPALIRRYWKGLN